MLLWIIFIIFLLIALIIDLGIFNKNPHVVSVKEASIWSVIWVSVALLFSIVIYFAFDNKWISNPTHISPYTAVVKYITGYLIELSLSVDNIFIIAVIFSSFAIPKKYQHEVLFYGVIGAIVFRALMIYFGIALINHFTWITYVFGIFLLITAYKMLVQSDEEYNPKKSKLFILIKKIFPVTYMLNGDKFFLRRKGIRAATPLLIALIIIEFTDLFFAIDSIPAILAISADPFIVFSSNILAVMGLRSMYFLISNMLNKFRYINYSLVAILAFVGIKMIIGHYVNIPEWVSLGVIVLSLAIGIYASIQIPEKPKESTEEYQQNDL
ncbi:MAG TPA: TerC family protein [Chitinophagaceae bacterium]|nr:TerC family protein [Chitinophagaceae bacterium]